MKVEKNKPKEHTDDSFWNSIEEIARNIIKVMKDTLLLIKTKK